MAHLDSRQQLIARLADGEYHSGEDLGESLGVSRSAVWKQLQKLSEWGIELDSCRRRGYRIPGGLSLLDRVVVESNLCPNTAAVTQLEIMQQVDSTNDVAMHLASGCSATGCVVLAEMQTAGKGRRGRTWISPYGRNIYLSVVRRFSGGAAVVQGLSLAVGVVVVHALKAFGASGLSLKWPNDILWKGKKLGGILLEINGDPAGSFDVIVGLGINVNMAIGEGEAIGQEWTTLAEITGVTVDRSRLSAHLANSLLPMLASFEVKGFTSYRDAWLELDSCCGQAVKLSAGEQEICGVARGVTQTGALCIETDEGLLDFSGGEISLRTLNDT
jgi:BirA family transcriptional regulator, biotin operon repressor / biotin---[acetyl-CoA-carboxylase] ligase